MFLTLQHPTSVAPDKKVIALQLIIKPEPSPIDGVDLNTGTIEPKSACEVSFFKTEPCLDIVKIESQNNDFPNMALNLTKEVIPKFPEIKSQETLTNKSQPTEILKSPFFCELCGKCYKISGYLSHLRRVHPNLKQFTCSLCQEVFEKIDLYFNHLRSHTAAKPHTCEICHKPFIYSYQVKKHMVVHSVERETLKCEVCQKTFTSKSGFKVHKLHHTRRSHECKLCNKTFVYPSVLKDHINNVHTKKFECEICQEKFHAFGTYRRHKQSHKTNVPNKNYVCRICGKRFDQQFQLKKHNMLTHPPDLQTNLCDICGKVLTRESFRTHKLTHADNKPFQCHTCGKAFRAKRHLALHSQTHTGNRNHSCSICGQKFTQRTPLVIHMRRHTGERPYKCDLCEKGFVSRCLLNTHKANNHKLVRLGIENKPKS